LERDVTRMDPAGVDPEKLAHDPEPAP
jgi:hypothetical protein